MESLKVQAEEPNGRVRCVDAVPSDERREVRYRQIHGVESRKVINAADLLEEKAALLPAQRVEVERDSERKVLAAGEGAVVTDQPAEGQLNFFGAKRGSGGEGDEYAW